MTASLRVSRLVQSLVRLQIAPSRPATASTSGTRQVLARSFYCFPHQRTEQNTTTGSLADRAEVNEVAEMHQSSESENLASTLPAESQSVNHADGAAESQPEGSSTSSEVLSHTWESQAASEPGLTTDSSLESLDPSALLTNTQNSTSTDDHEDGGELLFQIAPDRFKNRLPKRFRQPKLDMSDLNEPKTTSDGEIAAVTNTPISSNGDDEAAVVTDILSTPTLKTSKPKKIKLRHRDNPDMIKNKDGHHKHKTSNSDGNKHNTSKDDKPNKYTKDKRPAGPDTREPWKIQRDSLRQKFPQGWSPLKRLSPDALAGIRALHAQFPDDFSTDKLAAKFEVSPEAIRRILRTKWQPSAEEEAERQNRWFKRGMAIWERYAELGLKPPKKWRDAGVGEQAWEARKRAMGGRDRAALGDLADDTFAGRKPSYQRQLQNKIM
ncbi:hypothetical protein BROUX41_005473 [Berkeleyomyces rouxiae]|uniref:uncharacterized protein n=1 Tax=Berkeleyomyces rouxiae TaxID=2035830 RepID=UPI003B7D492B